MNHIRPFHIFIYESIHQFDSIITLEDLMRLNDDMITKYGGLKGVRDLNQLKYIVAKPFQTAFGTDLYPTIYHKAASVFESIVNTHPFTDGNKRTAFECLKFILNNNGINFNKEYDSSRPFIVNTFTKRYDIEAIVRWIRRNSTTGKKRTKKSLISQ